MERKKVTIRAVDTDAWDVLHNIRFLEQRMVGAIIADAIFAYWEANYDEE